MTETALQRRIAETLIENCSYFFPDVTEPPSSSVSPPLTFTCTSPTSPNITADSTSSQSYMRNSNSFTGSSPYSSPNTPSNSSDLYSNQPKEALPHHPLVDSAQDEGVVVSMLDGGSSHQLYQRQLSSPTPTDSIKPITKPIPPPRTSSSSSITPPLSPPPHRRNPLSPVPRVKPGHVPVAGSMSGTDLSVGSEVGGGVAQDNVNSGVGGKSEDHNHRHPPVPAVR